MTDVAKLLDGILGSSRDSFASKSFGKENNDHDPLMDAFEISPDQKRENRQYWGRELGMCWQLLVTTLATATRPDAGPPIRVDAGETGVVAEHAVGLLSPRLDRLLAVTKKPRPA